MTTEDFISKAIGVHGEKYDYSKVEYVNTLTKVTIICPIHGEFEQTPKHHLRRKQGCPKCSKNAKYTTETFIEAARKIHGDKYDYSKVDYVNCSTKVTIICSVHGEFEQTPTHHLIGCGCPRCSGNVKYTTEIFIEEARRVHGDKYDYSKVEYIDSKTPVIIICPIHGEFKQIPNNHLNGHGCTYCGNNIRHTTEEFIEAARKVHGNKYDYSKVHYIDNRTPVTIICPIHGEFQQSPSTHLRGRGCSYCNGSPRYTTETFIEALRKVHGNKYDYSLVEYVDCHTKITIICPEHGKFEQVAENHLQGSGCPKCAGITRYTTESFIEAARKVHGDKYDYSKVKYVNNHTKITIICPIHGEFEKTPAAHLSGQGCQKCIGRIRHTTETFIESARIIHGDKYDYSKVEYINNHTKVTIICPEHGEFEIRPNNHLNGHGCKSCKNSNLTKRVTDKLEQNNIEYTIEQQFEWLVYKRNLRIDIYLPKYNVAIECHGLQHFKPIDYFGGEENFKYTTERDKNKYDLCKLNGVKIFYFSNHKIKDYSLGRVYNDIDELLNVIINET